MVLHGDAPKVSRDDQIAAHFTGAKAGWRKPFDELVAQLKAFGPDFDVWPVKSYVNLQRGEKKFGIVQVTGPRMAIGIKNSGAPTDDRFEDGSAWNPMVTHRVHIDDPRQIDSAVIERLRQAYDKAG
jgi:hypothetical protein